MYYILAAIALILVVVIAYKRGHARGFAEANGYWEQIERKRQPEDELERIAKL